MSPVKHSPDCSGLVSLSSSWLKRAKLRGWSGVTAQNTLHCARQLSVGVRPLCAACCVRMASAGALKLPHHQNGATWNLTYSCKILFEGKKINLLVTLKQPKPVR